MLKIGKNKENKRKFNMLHSESFSRTSNAIHKVHQSNVSTKVLDKVFIFHKQYLLNKITGSFLGGLTIFGLSLTAFKGSSVESDSISRTSFDVLQNNFFLAAGFMGIDIL